MAGGKVSRRQVIQRAVGAHFVVVTTPGGDENTRLREASEPLVVQAFVAEATVETLDERVLRRLAGSDELQADVILDSPLVKRLACEFRPLIGANGTG